MRKILFYSILIFVFSIGIGYYYSSLWKKENMSAIEENLTTNVLNTATETVSVEEKVSYNASFALKKYYNECGHFKFNYAELPNEVINLTKAEVENLYPDWTVEEFSSNNVVLSQNLDNICDEHYVLKLEDENVEVYHIESDEHLKLYKSTDISKEYLTSDDINNLEQGIYVYGIANLNSAIEDFE